jgi:hypothetical protein
VILPRAISSAPTVANPPKEATSGVAVDLSGTTTDESAITDTISAVEQKVSTPPDAEPDHSSADTVVSAVDGELTGVDLVNVTTITNDGSASDSVSKRAVSRGDFHEVFAGTGTGESDRDCAIEGTAYLTYKLVSNATYGVDDCLDYCAGVDGCGKQ